MRVTLFAMSFLLALGAPALLAPAIGRAQLLGGASRAVRGHGSVAAPRVSAGSTPRSSGTSSGARGGAMPGVAGPPTRSGPPAAGGSRAAPQRPVGPPPAASPPERHRGRGTGWGLGLGFGGTAWGVPLASADVATSSRDAQRSPDAPRRDDFAGGGGVSASGPIGLAALPPREPPIFTRALRSAAIVPSDAPDRLRARVGVEAQLVLPRAARLSVWGVIELPASVDLVVGYAGYGEPNGAGFDAIAIGRLGVAWRFASERWLRGRIGVAARHFQDWLGAQLGIEAQLGLEAEIADEIVVTISGAAGTLGSAWAFQARATIEADLDGIRLFAGYDHLALQPFDSSQRGADLGGPIVGISVPID